MKTINETTSAYLAAIRKVEADPGLRGGVRRLALRGIAIHRGAPEHEMAYLIGQELRDACREVLDAGR